MLLRLGVVLGGRLVEERIFAGSDVTVGRSARNAVIVPSEAIPARWRLFRHGQRGFEVTPAAGMEARVATDEGVRSYQSKPGTSIALPVRCRGKLVAGDITFLFQVLRPPPAQPRPQLPPSVRATVWSQMDRAFAALCAVSFLAHLGFTLYLRSVDWPRRPDLEEMPERFVRWVVKRPLPQPTAVAPKPKPKPRAAPATSHEARPAAKPSTAPQLTSEQRKDELRKQVNVALVKAIGAVGPNGALADLLRPGGIDQDQAKAFENVVGINVATDDTAPLRSLIRPSGTGSIASVGAIRGGAEIAAAGPTGEARERRVPLVFRSDAPVVDGGRIDPGVLSREVRGRMGALRACYERALKRTPTLAGKIVLRFTITPAGTVSEVAVDDDTVGDPELVKCMKALVAAWRFPAPPDGPVEVAFPFVFQPAQ